MSTRAPEVPPDAGPPPCEWLERLPWFVNGSADRREAEAIAAHVSDCPHCTAELAFWRNADGALRDESASPRIDSTEQLERLLTEIGPDDARPRHAPSRYQRLLGTLRATFEVPGWALAAPALLVVAMALSLLPEQATPPDGSFETLSSPASTPAWELSVVIDDAVTLAELRELLDAHGLRPVSGPSPAGAWRLARSADTPLDAIVEALRRDPRVLLAEPGPAR